VLFYYSIFSPKDFENKPLNNRINNNLYEDLITKEANDEFISLGIQDDKRNYFNRIPFSAETKVSKSSSLTNKNFFNNFNKQEHMLIDEANKYYLERGIVKIEIIFLTIRKISKIVNTFSNEKESENLANYKFRFNVGIPKCFINQAKSPKKFSLNKGNYNISPKNNQKNVKSIESNEKNLASEFYTYRFKKNLKEIIQFNSSILDKYNKYITKKSKLIFELKNLNDDFLNHGLLHESSIQQLNVVYIKMCQIYLFFIREFLKFSGVDEETIENIMGNFDEDFKKKKCKNENAHRDDRVLNNHKNKIFKSQIKYIDINKSIKYASPNKNSDDFELATNERIYNNNFNKFSNKNFRVESSFFSEIEEKSFINDNSIIIDYVNNTLMQKEYVFVQLIEVNYSQNKFEISIDLNLSIEQINFKISNKNKDESNCFSMNAHSGNNKSFRDNFTDNYNNKYNNQRTNIFVSFNLKSLFSYLNNYSASYSKFGVIKSLLNLLNDVNEIVYNNGKKTFEKELTILLNELLNDLFHIRSEIFYLFNLNKLLVKF